MNRRQMLGGLATTAGILPLIEKIKPQNPTEEFCSVTLSNKEELDQAIEIIQKSKEFTTRDYFRLTRSMNYLSILNLTKFTNRTNDGLVYKFAINNDDLFGDKLANKSESLQFQILRIVMFLKSQFSNSSEGDWTDLSWLVTDDKILSFLRLSGSFESSLSSVDLYQTTQILTKNGLYNEQTPVYCGACSLFNKYLHTFRSQHLELNVIRIGFNNNYIDLNLVGFNDEN